MTLSLRGLWSWVLLACVSSLLLMPGSAMATRVWLGGTVYQLFAKGTNGYSLRLSTYENRLYHRISLTAENGEHQYVRYSVQGIPRKGRINARFPGVGQIKVVMQPTKVRELPPPKGCKLPKAVIEYGVFVGTIRLRGEMGYTKLATKQVHGLIKRSTRQECQLAPSARASGVRAPHGGITHFTDLHLVTGDVVVNAEGGTGTAKASFEATAHEERDGMDIVRGSPGVSSPGDLEANADMTSASISPPTPFLGTATYSGPPRSTGCALPCPPPLGQMSGTLRLPLPGLGVVPLTGPQVEATLTENVRAY